MSDALTPIDRLIIRRDQQRRKGAHAEAAQSNREIGLLLAEAGEYERGLAYLAEALDAFPGRQFS